jgi:CRP/FNR family transcriptional regulator, cyclic AMP receptor protein
MNIRPRTGIAIDAGRLVGDPHRIRLAVHPVLQDGLDMTALLSIPLFKGMTAAELDRLEARSHIIEPRDGSRVFAEGDPSDAVYVIVGGTGHIRVSAVDRNSKGAMIGVLQTGDIFGEVGVLDGSTRTFDCLAEGRVRLMRIEGHVFLDALDSSVVLGKNLSRMFAQRLRRISALLRDATFESLEVRLAKQVLYLASREGRRREQGIQLAGRFRQTDLADLLGATSRSVITILNVWRADGLVIYDTVKAQLTLCREDDLRRIVDPDFPHDGA